MVRSKSETSEGDAMAGKPLYFRLGENDRISLSDLRLSINRITGILADLDAAASENPAGAVKWQVTALGKQSPPVIGVTAIPVARRDRLTRQITRRDTSPLVEATLIAGVRSLDAGERPQQRSVPDAAIDKIQGLAVQSRRMGDIRVYSDVADAAISETTLTGIRKVIGSATRSKGSIVGTLDTIAVHFGNEIRVWDENSSRAVRCRYPDSLEEDVKGLLRQRVMVTGLVAFNARGQAVSVVVEKLTPYDAPDTLPTIQQMSGLFKRTAKDDVSVKEYLEHLRQAR